MDSQERSHAELELERIVSVAGVVRDATQPCGWRNRRAELAETRVAQLKRERDEVRAAIEAIRDAMLSMAEGGFISDQIDSVLGIIDDNTADYERNASVKGDGQ